MDEVPGVNRGALERFSGSPVAWLYVVVAAAASAYAGVQIGHPYLLPMLNAALAYPVFIGGVASGKRVRTVAQMLLWALALSVTTVWLTQHSPFKVEAVTLHGSAYRNEMFSWIRSGVGKESTPTQFLPLHALHFAIFCAAAFLTAGFAALAFGAVLLNYMNFYVGSLILHTEHRSLAAIVGWPIYAEIRVIGYVVSAVALAELSRRVFLRRPLTPGWERALGVGLWLVVLDAVVKIAIAPQWRDLLTLLDLH